MSEFNKKTFGAPLDRCNATMQLNENTNPETSHIKVLENKINLLNSKYDESLNYLKKIEYKLDALLCQELKKLNFPIKSESDLKNVDEQIGQNFSSFLPTITKILQPQGLKKNLSKIISEELVLKYNYEGIKGKSCFKSFENLNKALYEVSMHEGYDEKQYATEIKKAFHLIKVRQFKKLHLERKSKNLN